MKIKIIVAGIALFIVAAFVMMFSVFLCPFGKCDEKDEKSTLESAITEKEIDELAKMMNEKRFEINKELIEQGGIAGENYDGTIYSSSGGGSGDGSGVASLDTSSPFIEQIKQVVHQVESGGGSDYAVINAADVGGQVRAMTIGKYQMTGSHAASMLVLIRKLNSTFFDEKIPRSSSLGVALSGSLSWATWQNRSLQSSEIPGVKAVLTSEWGKKGQEQYMNQLVAGYVETIKKKGVTDPKAQCYLADTVHQKGEGGFNKYFNAYIGNGSGLTLDGAHAGALKDPALSKYRTRRDTAKSMCSKVNPNPENKKVDEDESKKDDKKDDKKVESKSSASEKKEDDKKDEKGDEKGDGKTPPAALDKYLTDAMFPIKSNNFTPYGNTYGGDRSFGGKRKHSGTDIMAPAGQPLVAAMDGEITGIGWLKLGGYRINLDVGNGYTLYYAHMKSYAPGIKKGSKVKKGDLIGYSGNTGYGPEGTTGNIGGPHLHFSIYKNGLKDENTLNSYPYLKWWESKSDVTAGLDMGNANLTGGDNSGVTTMPDKPGEDGIKMARAHIRTLIQLDEYGLRSMDLTKENTVEEDGEYYDTVFGKMYRLSQDKEVLDLLGGKIEDHWGIEDNIMNARMLVYQCYLVGNDKGFFSSMFSKIFGINVPTFKKGVCDKIEESLGEEYIKPGDIAMLLQVRKDIVKTYGCEAGSGSDSGSDGGSGSDSGGGSGDATLGISSGKLVPYLKDALFPIDSDKYNKFGDSYGGDRSYGGPRKHSGTDIMAPEGLPLVAAMDGTITGIGWLERGGYRINLDVGEGYVLYYAHMKSYAFGLKKGSKVKKGDLLGYLGNTGYGPEGTTGKIGGPHLHFSIYKDGLNDENTLNSYPYLKYWESLPRDVSPEKNDSKSKSEKDDKKDKKVESKTQMLVENTQPKINNQTINNENIIKSFEYEVKGKVTSNDVKCGKGEKKTLLSEQTTYAINHPELEEIIKLFEKYSLANLELKTLDKEIDTDFPTTVDFYLEEAYETEGIDGSMTEINLDGGSGGATGEKGQVIKIGKGKLGYPVDKKGAATRESRGFKTKQWPNHMGLDIAAPRGTKVIAAEDGVVAFVGETQGYGNAVLVLHEDENGKKYITKYGHILDNRKNCPKCVDKGNYKGDRSLPTYYDSKLYVPVKVGQKVERGEVIAYVGSAGSSTGYHLHFEVLLTTDVQGARGYKGVVDPAPYLR